MRREKLHLCKYKFGYAYFVWNFIVQILVALNFSYRPNWTPVYFAWWEQLS